MQKPTGKPLKDLFCPQLILHFWCNRLSCLLAASNSLWWWEQSHILTNKEVSGHEDERFILKKTWCLGSHSVSNSAAWQLQAALVSLGCTHPHLFSCFLHRFCHKLIQSSRWHGNAVCGNISGFAPEILHVYPPVSSLLCVCRYSALDNVFQLVIKQCFPEAGRSWGGHNQGGTSWGWGLAMKEIHTFWTEQRSQLFQRTIHLIAVQEITMAFLVSR